MTSRTSGLSAISDLHAGGAPLPLRDRMFAYVRSLQDRICAELERLDGAATFSEDKWNRPGGGGGWTRVIQDGGVFEKGGVNVAAVHGSMPESLARKMGIEEGNFFATGISVVVHPASPRIPTAHANYRYFECDNGDSWFAGGADLTPYAPLEEDAVHFHATLKAAADPFGSDLYPRYKQACDNYFHLRHRGESRGVGGVFYDYLRGDIGELERLFRFQQSMGDAFLSAYGPIVERRRTEAFTDREKKFQCLRRGRYVEFNLVYDRGTLFGLETSGRTESILMSLPPVVHFDYDPQMEHNDDERLLMSWLRNPRDWTGSAG